MSGGPQNTLRLTIRDDDDQCWSAFVIFDDRFHVLVMLYASAEEDVCEADLNEIRQAYRDAVEYLESQER